MAASPGATGRRRAYARSSSPAFSASAGDARAASTRRHEAARRGRQDTQREEDAERNRLRRERGHDAAKISRTKIRTDPTDGGLRERVPESEPQRAAGHADQRAFGHDQQREMPARDPQHAQQRKLRAPPHDRMRLRRKHQQTAGEERDQRQHVEVDAVRSRQAGARGDRRLRAEDGETRRQHRAQAFGERCRVDTGAQPQVDPAQQSEAIERGCAPAMSITARR